MQIIEVGKIPAEGRYTLRCTNCKTKFSFLKKEGKVAHSPWGGNYIVVSCPLCEKLQSIDL